MIRRAVPADAPSVAEIYRPYVAETAYSFEYTPPAPEEMRSRMERVMEILPWLVWEEEGEILGYAYADLPFSRMAYRWCAEPSIYLKKEARGRGIGRALYQALEAILTAQGYRKVYALITSENTDSLAFHQAMGYRLTAQLPDCGWKLGRWHGVLWMEKGLCSDGMPNTIPVPWGEIVENDEKLEKILAHFSLFPKRKM